MAKQAACSQCQSNSRGIGTAVSPLISACHMLSCKLHQRGNDRLFFCFVFFKKHACGTWSPPDVIPEVKQVDTISSYPQTAGGKEKPRSGPHSNVSFLLVRSVGYQHMPYFNP